MLLRAVVLILVLAMAAVPQSGAAHYKLQCASCHGLKGLGGRGPDLVSGRWTHGSADEDLARVISKGVSGGGMPSFGEDFDEQQLRQLVAFIRSLGASSGPPVQPAGNPDHGREVYWGGAACSQCHMIQGRGGRLGPDLTRIGSQRSLGHLRESLAKPSADIADSYQAVRVTPRGARPVTGIRRNEDNFTIQLFDTNEKYYSFRRDALERLEELKDSLMPPTTLPASDLDDLVAYLDSLRGKP
jgi:cytochrome c oxidase cbb3-type subunit 3